MIEVPKGGDRAIGQLTMQRVLLEAKSKKPGPFRAAVEATRGATFSDAGLAHGGERLCVAWHKAWPTGYAMRPRRAVAVAPAGTGIGSIGIMDKKPGAIQGL